MYNVLTKIKIKNEIATLQGYGKITHKILNIKIRVNPDYPPSKPSENQLFNCNAVSTKQNPFQFKSK